ncbi:uncharacterized protein B0I36DRAFT_56514 [Microdochium trichocladiopsis]|uniref:Uncharacterized protein n=1 Tax=Microdochium trichocladiopsis TaxID=1682393 RepID=A0A9P8XTC6_9PEZI|nr:uncharacterized protein B0I36DRAFT_56514 [Microdochium trichocladiopsis]KAH7010845.1 hypothetical protein B0I36DRAFT_56514 [Microdochium trichocladiopsis]
MLEPGTSLVVKFGSTEDNGFKGNVTTTPLEVSIADDGRFIGGDEDVANYLVLQLLDLPADKRCVRVRASALDDPAYRLDHPNSYVRLREHVRRYERALNFLVCGGVHYYWEQEASNLIKAVIELRGLALPSNEDYESWFAWPTRKPDQVLRVRFSKQIGDFVRTGYYEDDWSAFPRKKGMPEDHPIWLKHISPRIVWERVAPAAALMAVGEDSRNHTHHINLDNWVLSHRQPRDLQRYTPIASV